MNTLQKPVTKNDLLSFKLPASIDEVIVQLENIIDYCETSNSSAGYFAVLYHKVTCKVKECISDKDFEDGVRMEKLDVMFASRYLNAFYLWLDNKSTSESWKVAFDAIADKSILVIQHLLLGMNAHINLDLGISTGDVMKGTLLEEIHNDFNTINSILGSMINSIEGCLTSVNPLMKLLDLDIFNYNEMLVQFSITIARDGAWKFAEELSGKIEADYENCILERDQRIQQLGISIQKPQGFFLRFIVRLIRLFEKKKVKSIIDLLGK